MLPQGPSGPVGREQKSNICLRNRPIKLLLDIFSAVVSDGGSHSKKIHFCESFVEEIREFLVGALK